MLIERLLQLSNCNATDIGKLRLRCHFIRYKQMSIGKIFQPNLRQAGEKKSASGTLFSFRRTRIKPISQKMQQKNSGHSKMELLNSVEFLTLGSQVRHAAKENRADTCPWPHSISRRFP